MTQHFDVVGELDGDVEGDVMGDIMGLSDAEVGRAVKRRARALALPKKPKWRAQLAPGVPEPGEGMIPMPMTPLAGGGTFLAALPTITWQGQLQKPFRSERLLVSTVRTGASAVGRLLGQVFVGTDLQQADITAFDIELIGQANSFGTRLTCVSAEPGVLIRIQVTLSSALAGADSIFASMLWLGRVVH